MKIFAGNWKLYKNPKETRAFFEEFKSSYKPGPGSQVVFFPPATNLEAASQSLAGTNIWFGSQNCYSENQGAFTGEISAQTAKDLGAQIVLLGHSERRALFGETNESLQKKIQCVLDLDIVALLCIGETLPQREEEKTFEVLRKQLAILKAYAGHQKIWIAYEPVWAIGTGKVATPEQVAEAHAAIKKDLVELGFKNTPPILYGGSVKPENAKQLISIPNVDGFLVGGASLKVDSFLQICQ